MGRKKKDSSPLPPSVPGMYAGGNGYLDDEYSLTVDGEAARDRWVSEQSAREEADFEKGLEQQSALGDYVVSDDPMQFRAVEIEGKRHAKIREEDARLARDPRSWIMRDRMTQTETTLRVAFYLIRHDHVTSDLTIAISGAELARRDRPKFPVATYLEENGWFPDPDVYGWRGTYRKAGVRHAIQLTAQRATWRIVAHVAPDVRILVCTCGGTLSETRGQAEHGPLRAVTQEAMFRPGAGPDDVIVAVAPRSRRSRTIAKALQGLRQVRGSGVVICTVDRAGGMTNLPLIGTSGDQD